MFFDGFCTLFKLLLVVVSDMIWIQLSMNCQTRERIEIYYKHVFYLPLASYRYR